MMIDVLERVAISNEAIMVASFDKLKMMASNLALNRKWNS